MKTSSFCLHCGGSRPGALVVRCKGCDKLYCEDCVTADCRSCGATPHHGEPWFYSEGLIQPTISQPG